MVLHFLATVAKLLVSEAVERPLLMVEDRFTGSSGRRLRRKHYEWNRDPRDNEMTEDLIRTDHRIHFHVLSHAALQAEPNPSNASSAEAMSPKPATEERCADEHEKQVCEIIVPPWEDLAVVIAAAVRDLDASTLQPRIMGIASPLVYAAQKHEASRLQSMIRTRIQCC
ncbi:uncharacterized protein BO95DRAFT_434345 [Aspergillus brunneoviolaceus CBS 621.78]|uniref:Uncharacterized protein n=1 Tax=Aspergillus brunneoviolaceus CBS 621.78 TaxID=1450534 RepID=A0ACD1G1J0_9EURO|nr:hypothetical protein BO95DRAFT_434345 [Aspergillus brunneoviolaceus CBS 621.78]RAH43104.1 hypothetical protein BO95DRAFT_434345 [Aspergillus brunneoviolaceus CBS 621.78]